MTWALYRIYLERRSGIKSGPLKENIASKAMLASRNLEGIK